MTEWNSRANDIFVRAAEIDAPAERLFFLKQQCDGDADLQAQVESLLSAGGKIGSFLEKPAASALATDGATATYPQITEGPGTIIGPYKLMEQIGEGGFGLVFVAEQHQPVRRKVALKIIKPGMDSAQVIARFEAERQALALMDHANIARVLDAGTTDSGRPYFVMELVKGTPITGFCDRNRLTPRQRLELFVPVCQAIQHAHQKGIIHRDIKPSNVLVAVYDGQPVPKVIDFGIAKATDQRLTEKTLFTKHGQIIGTFEYMSPEQARLDALDVDTRSDVYSLAVLLYELLTGTTPLDKERLRQAALDEILRLIREEDPPRPSNRLSASGGGLPVIAAYRKTESQKLPGLMRGDLDWIVMKGLDKDRSRRYETASALAADVRRYLDEEPVEARPPSAVYRLRKFVKRNRGRVIATTCTMVLLLALLLLGGLGVWWQLRQTSALERAVAEDLQEADLLQEQERWPEALQTLERASGRLGANGPRQLRERIEQRRKNVDMVAQLDEARLHATAVTMEERRFDREEAAQAYAAAFVGYGLDLDALTPDEAAERIRNSAIRARLVAALDEWAARKKSADSIVAVARLADDDPWRQQLRDPEVRRDRIALERLAQEKGVLDQPPTNLVQLSQALDTAKSHEAAQRLLRQAQQRYPAHFWINLNLAHLLSRNAGTRPEAVGFLRAALALRPESPMVHNDLGAMLHAVGKWAEAETEFRKTIELKSDDPVGHFNLGNALKSQGKMVEAEAAYCKAIELRIDYPDVHYRLGITLNMQKKWEEAEAEFQKAIVLKPDADAYFELGNALLDQLKYEKAEAAFRKAIDLKAGSGAWYNLGLALVDQNKWDEAEKVFRRAIGLGLEHTPGKTAEAYMNLGEVCRELKKWPEAEDALRKAVQLNPDDADASNALGNVLAQQRKWADAEAVFRETIKIKPKHAMAYFNLGKALKSQGKVEDAERALREGIEIQPDDAHAHNELGITLAMQRKWTEAEAEFNKAIQHRRDYASAYGNLARTLIAQEKLTEAEAAYRKAIKFTEGRPDRQAEAYCDLGQVLKRQGRFAEALAALKHGHELGSETPGWHYPSAEWVREAERLIDIDARLPQLLSGEEKPADIAECVDVAHLCQLKQLNAAASRLYQRIFMDDPQRADDLSRGLRYSAACAAALAGCRQGKDAGELEDQERTRLRRQSLEWLRLDLAARTRQLEKDPDKRHSQVARNMDHWLTDPDFNGVREPEALAKLPEAERGDWQQLWEEVAALLKLAQSKDK